MALVEVTYKRGSTFLQNKYRVKEFERDEAGQIVRDERGRKKRKFKLDEKGNPIVDTAHGLVGELWIHGLQFETLERMDGFMHMAGDKSYSPSTIYWDKNYGYVINPELGALDKKDHPNSQYNILFHPVEAPSGLDGCVGVGFFDAQGNLTDGKWALAAIYEQAGGKTGQKEAVSILLKVEGHMKAVTSCKPWTYAA